MRTRRKKSEMPFAEALEFATKRLKVAEKERTQAQDTLTRVNAEIPALQRTITALQQQLDPSTIPTQTVMWSQPPGDPLAFPVTAETLTEDITLPDPEGAELLPE